MPARLIEDQHGLGSAGDMARYFGQIGPPAHHPVQSQLGTCLDDPGQRRALPAFSNANFPTALPQVKSAGQPLRALRVEPQHPVAHSLQPHAVCKPTPPASAASRRVPPAQITAKAKSLRS